MAAKNITRHRVVNNLPCFLNDYQEKKFYISDRYFFGIIPAAGVVCLIKTGNF